MNSVNYAAIDIGSNALRLLIMNIVKEGPEVRFHKSALVRAPIRIGKEVFIEGKEKIQQEKIISSKIKENMIKAIKSYSLLMEIYEVKNYLAYATSAMREAKNAKEVIEAIREKTGIEIEVIDGKKEAFLIFNSELKEYTQKFNSYLYMDVGGGSTELTIFHKGTRIASKSFPIGTIRLLKGLISQKEIEDTFRGWINTYGGSFQNIDVIATGGNINYILKQSGQGDCLSLGYLKNYLEQLSELSYEERIWKHHMKPDRADVVVPALGIYLSVMEIIKADKIYVPKIGLADGMIHYLYQKKPI